MVNKAPAFPPQTDYKLPGWELLWVQLEITGDVDGLDPAREAQTGRMKQIMRGLPQSEHPTMQSVRSLFRNAGCDPTRHRPSSEALARRLLRGDDIPAILPAVDINNIWSTELLVPCCVVNPQKISGSLLLRKGQSGEFMESMRGPFNLEGKPVLVDEKGPFGTPITDAERVKVTKPTGTYWIVAYLPKSVVRPEFARGKLDDLVGRLSNVRVTYPDQ